MRPSPPAAAARANAPQVRSAPLLAAASHPANYNTYTNGAYPPSPTQHASDPQQQMYDREYLDRIVAQTSENLIDIFAPPLLPAMSVTPSSRGEWYRGLLERVAAPEAAPAEVVLAGAAAVGADERSWLKGLVERGEEARRGVSHVEGVGRLVVGLD